jgi:hypothetical protein
VNKNGIKDTGETDPCSNDTDGDLIQDGTETGITLSDIGPDTDTSVFQPDMDPGSTTDATKSDTDEDGMLDGKEDPNHNGRIDPGERDPFVKDYTFISNSAILTNSYMPSAFGGLLEYSGTGTWSGYGRYIEVIGEEVFDSVNCLKILIKGHGNNANPDLDPEWYYLWLAEDTDHYIWALKIESSILGSIPLGKAYASLFMPADPEVGQRYYPYGTDYHEVLETDAEVPQLGTGLGPYSGCLKVKIVSGADIDIQYSAPGIGVVKAEINNGGVNGWELASQDEDTDRDGIRDKAENDGCTDANDADTDDDGILDGDEDANHNGMVDTCDINPWSLEPWEGNPCETDPCNPDTDGDGIQDGTELGYTMGSIGPDTDTDTNVFQPDLEPTDKTNPRNPDTDKDGLTDGQEDKNYNGKKDSEEHDPADRDNTFYTGPGDLVWSINDYLPAKVGTRIIYAGTGTLSGYGRYIEIVGSEKFLDINMLKAIVKGHGNHPDPDQDPEWYYIWLAPDNEGSVWVLRFQAAGYPIINYDPNAGFLQMPADPIVGQIYNGLEIGVSINPDGSAGYGYFEVLETGVDVPQLSTGAGPFSNCLKVRVVKDGGIEEYIQYIAPDIGIVKEEKTDDGQNCGWEFVSLDLDSDGDGLRDNLENETCTLVNDADTDDDGILDGDEDANHNGIVDPGETDPCDSDTDGDYLQDGTELGYVLGHYTDTNKVIFIPDQDPFTKTDPLNLDTDGDGQLDGLEDISRNGKVDMWERDPLNIDNEFSNSATLKNRFLSLLSEDGEVWYAGTGAWDGYRRHIEIVGYDIVSNINCVKVKVMGHGNHPDPDLDPEWYYLWLAEDTDQFVWIFKTYIAWPTEKTITFNYFNAPLFMPADPAAGQIYHPYGVGYFEVLETGIDVPKLSTGAGPFSDCLKVKVGQDCGIDENIQFIASGIGIVKEERDSGTGWELLIDTDNDGLFDNVENEFCTNAGDADTDDDGIPDGDEDADHDGKLDSGETDPCKVDTDGDGILDGTEIGLSLADIGTDTDTNVFLPDLDPLTTCTDVNDSDTDDDGIPDGDEDANHNGRVDSNETDPCMVDTDEDGIQDGTELGLTLADIGPDTDISVFQPDLDPSDTTSPILSDTDDDGFNDGIEDPDFNGRIDAGESDPDDENSYPIIQGDVNGDRMIDLSDVILTLQFVAGINSTQPVTMGADVNGDGEIGIEEAIYILGKITGLRE